MNRWRLIGKVVGVFILVSIAITAWAYGYDFYKDRLTIQDELAGISLGMKEVEVTQIKGEPSSENMDKGITALEGTTTLEYADYSGVLKMFVTLDPENNEVYRVCSLEDDDEVLGFGKYDSFEKIESKLGPLKERSINYYPNIQLVTYPQYNVAFEIIEGKVNMICITTEEKMKYIHEYWRRIVD